MSNLDRWYKTFGMAAGSQVIVNFEGGYISGEQYIVADTDFYKVVDNQAGYMLGKLRIVERGYKKDWVGYQAVKWVSSDGITDVRIINGKNKGWDDKGVPRPLPIGLRGTVYDVNGDGMMYSKGK